MPCLIVFICLGLPHENYTFGDSSETKYAVKPKKQSQGGLSGAIISTPDPLDFLETLKGSSKRQGEQLLRYNPQRHPLGAAPVLRPHLWTKLAELQVSIDFNEWNLGFHQEHRLYLWTSVGRATGLHQLQGVEPGVSQWQGSVLIQCNNLKGWNQGFRQKQRLCLWTRLAELLFSIDFNSVEPGVSQATAADHGISGPRWWR